MELEETFNPQGEDYSPLDAPVKKRNYTTHNIEPAPFEDIPEPEFIPPSYSDFEDSEETEEKTKEPDRVFNEPYSELSGKEKKMGAEMMAEMALDMYSKGCGLLGRLPQISESKIDKLMAEGEIDYNASLPTAEGDIPVKEFAREYNESIKTAFEVDEEFKNNVRPPLIRVFQKRGIGMTDEQLLMYYFATDIGVKGFQALTLKKQANQIIDALKENTQVVRQNNGRTQQPPQPTQQQSTVQNDSVKPEPTQYSKEEYTDDIHSATQKEPVFNEPEENLVSEMTAARGFEHEIKVPSNMPEFGDPDILTGIQEVAEKGIMSTRGRKPRTTRAPKSARKPRNSK